MRRFVVVNSAAAPFADVGISQYNDNCKPTLQVGQMKKFLLLVGVLLVGGCRDYSVESDDVVCDVEQGECTVCTDSDCSSSVSITIPDSGPRDKCDGTGTTNLLLGSCFTEQCVKGEKMLVTKIAGVNCVFRPKNAPNDEFVVGVCDDNGVCGN